jgi:hypothetical protein
MDAYHHQFQVQSTGVLNSVNFLARIGTARSGESEQSQPDGIELAVHHVVDLFHSLVPVASADSLGSTR